MTTLFYPAWESLEIRDLPVPGISEGGVLLKVAACGICGSELETYRNRSNRRTPPLVMGHEFCGTVVNPGTSPLHFKEGQQVVSYALVICGLCRPCRRGDTHLCTKREVFGMHRPGAFAEYVSVPASSLIPWPEGVPAQAACLAEPLANGVHIADRLQPHKPRTVVILGAGPIGLMCQQAVQVMLGVRTIISDTVPGRLETAKKLGAFAVAKAGTSELDAQVAEVSEGEGVDAVIDAVGSETTKQLALKLVRPGGAVVWIGLHENTISFDSYAVTLSEKTVYGSYAATLGELAYAVKLMSEGKVDAESWVQTFPLERGVEAFHRMLNAQGNDIKGVLLP
ncbi:MAG: alcohol dehydrogenase catalytic domain-containing protein [Ignavibacteriales bacterium]|nr:alcohol dehydrogenase catalytic domain-containing protein [Ignavibacteriales bacterium]